MEPGVKMWDQIGTKWNYLETLDKVKGQHVYSCLWNTLQTKITKIILNKKRGKKKSDCEVTESSKRKIDNH